MTVMSLCQREKTFMQRFFSFARQTLIPKPWKVLTAFYLIFSAIRIILAFCVTKTPVIMPDSALFLHLSSSIMTNGELLFRGQPIRYEYILYPLFIAPLHLLPQEISIFRAIQAANVFVMNLAIIPAYALTKAITGSQRKGIFLAFATLLMPDFLIAEQIMTESLSFPLILTVCYAFYRFYEAPPRYRIAVLWGGLGFLLYALKPGYVALPVCFFILLLWKALKTREADRAYQALAGILVMILSLGLYKILLQYGFHMSPVQSTLYGSQTHDLTWNHLLQVLNGLFLYATFVTLAFGFFPLYVPAAHLRALPKRDKDVLTAILLAIAAVIIGTVYVIYYDELGSGSPYAARIHVRYVAAFLPVLMAFMLSPSLEGKRLNTPFYLFISFSAVSLMRWDGSAVLSGYSHPVDAFLLTIATIETQGFSGKLLWPMVALIFLLVIAARIGQKGMRQAEKYAICGFLVFAFLLNSILSISLYRHHQDSTLPQAAVEAIENTGTANTLGVVQDGAAFWPEAVELDIASRSKLPVVEMDDVIANTNASGILSSFVPKTYWHELPVNKIPEPRKLILDSDILYAIVLSDQVSASSRTTSQKEYVMVDIAPGVPWIHSGLSGLNQGWVQTGSRFTLFDAAVRANGRIQLQLQARAGEGQAALILRCGSQEQVFPLGSELTWIQAEFAIENPSEAVTVTLEASGGNVFVKTYLVE